MAHNRYFIISSTDSNMNEIIDISVGTLETQRKSIDESQMVIKLHEQDHSDYAFLSEYTEYNHQQILPIMQSDEWQIEP